MKRKELMKRTLALTLSAAMIIGNIPAMAYASEVVETEDEGALQTVEATTSEDDAVNEEKSEDLDVQQAEPGQDEIIEVEGDTQLEEPVEIDNSVEEDAAAEMQMADQEIQVQSAEDDAKTAAAEYLKKNYVNSNKIISNGGTGVTKSADGLSYLVGLKVNGTGNAISSINFKKESPRSSYKSGWYMNSEWANTAAKTPSSLGSAAIKRPTAEQGAQTFTATLRLFSSDTSNDVINDETQATTEALATQEFTITLEAAEPNYTLTVKVQDEEGNAIDDAAIKLEKGWNTVSPKDSSYEMEKGATYTLTVTKGGYNDYKESNFTFNPTEVNTIKTVTLKKSVTRNVRFNVTDKSGNPIEGATVTVKKGYYDKVQPGLDGSYNLIEGTTYNYTVEAKNYKTVSNQNFIPDKDETINIQLEKNISKYTVSINPVDNDDKGIENASIKVTYEEEDEDSWDDETITVDLNANTDGTYTMNKGVTYTYTVTAPDYKEVTDTYTPSGDNENISINVKMVSSINPADVNTVNAIKAKFDKELGVLRPKYATDKNILDLVKHKIAGYTDIDTTGVTVSVKSSDATDWVGTDGIIHYKASAPSLNKINFKNVGLIFVFEKNGAKAETEQRNAVICWNCDYVNTQIEADKDKLIWDTMKGSNDKASEVTSSLTLPQCMGANAMTAWSKITWSSSNEKVISLKDTGWGSLIDAKEGVVTPQPEDIEVTLTATFNVNENLLNEYSEKVSDFVTLTKEFKVTVKGTGAVKPTEEELKAILDQYYTADQLKDFTTGDKLDTSACTGDIQLPKYTKIEDNEGKHVFENKEITVTADNAALTVNGYRVAVDRFASSDDIVANLIVTFTRESVTATKKIPVTVKPVTEVEMQAELNMMEVAKEHYFDGLNDGRYADKDSITGNLHPFQEMLLDDAGNPKWIYNNDDKTGKGIIADDMFKDTWEMEGAGYNKFKSSNNAVVAHENLVVTRREADTEITISSLLSSETYKDAAEKHPDNTLLQKLYKQPVSVTVTIQGTKPPVDSLQKKIEELKAFSDSLPEGSGAGQYPVGTKDKLQAAITEAEAVLNNESATDAEVRQEIKKLEEILKTVQASQNTVEATITAKINTVAGVGMDVSKMTVKADTAENYGYTKPESCKNKVTALDVLAAWHAATYGDDFKNHPEKYLIIKGGFISRIYGIDTYDVGILVNNKMPGSSTVDVAVVVTGDIVTFFRYSDLKSWQDLYLYFEGLPETVKVNEALNLTLLGYHPMSMTGEPETASTRSGYTIAALDAMGRQVVAAVTDENGAVTLQINTAGTYQITVVDIPKDSKETAYIFPKEPIVVTGTSDIPAAHIHSFGEWRTVSAATVFAAEQQERICACGEKETRTVGTPLKATIKVNMSTVPLKVKQATTKLKVSGLANGDAVASYTSGNKKVFTVDKNGKIKAGKKKGSAKLTITLKSGLKKTITVKVQKKTVKTKKIQGLQKTITLKKGAKTTLKPVLNPLTSQQKIKYTSSRKKVATVSSKGVIKAKKAGKTTITVKSGSKKYKITVKVK